MNLWRSLQAFSMRLPLELWLVISLLCSGLSLGISQVLTQRHNAHTVALRQQTVALNSNSAELNQIGRDLDALKKRGNITDEELRSMQERLDEHKRKSEIIRARMKQLLEQ